MSWQVKKGLTLPTLALTAYSHPWHNGVHGNSSVTTCRSYVPYPHDLESFFYVLLWICACRTREKEFLCSAVDRPKRNILTKWSMGSFDDISYCGRERTSYGCKWVQIYLGEIQQAFNHVKLLCEKIQGILFPVLEDGTLFIGTLPDPLEKLYLPIIEALHHSTTSL